MAWTLPFQTINRLWEDSRRSGILTELYQEQIEDWRLMKCARALAKHVGDVRNAKLVRLLEQVMDWLRIRMSKAYRRARDRLRELSQAGKFRVGVCGSAGLRGDLLHFYLSLKNGLAPGSLLIELYG